jgi:hypothetical protein
MTDVNRSVGRTIACVVVLLCLSSAAAGAVFGVGAMQTHDPAGTTQMHDPDGTTTIDSAPDRSIDASGPETATLLAVQNGTEAENVTRRHENPDDLNEDGDLGQVESWLLGRLAGQLSEGAIQLSEGQYEFAREFLGESFRERLGQYVDVAGETEESSDEEAEETEETFRETRDTQEQLTDTVEEYEETREDYEDAREENDTERTRDLARDLDDRATEIGTQIDTLRQFYERLENVSGEDLAEAIAALDDLDAEIQAEISEIRAAEFVETELTVEAARERISFLEPLTATGRLSTAGGEPVANERIRLTIAGQSRQVETDASGAFEFTYRPVVLPLATSSLSVQYVPDDQSVYLGSEASVPVTVDQVQPRIDDLTSPDELAYAETVPVSGDVAVEDVPVGGVSLEILVAGQRLGTTQVTRGSFDTTVTVPASVPDGDRELVVRLPEEDRAIGGASESRGVTVRETATALSVNATQITDSEMAVTGTLETVDGVGVGGEPVEVSVDGQVVATVTTGDGGAFTGRVTVSAPSTAREFLIAAAYEQPATNLGPAEAETIVEMEPGGGTGDENGTGTSGDENGTGTSGDENGTGTSGENGAGGEAGDSGSGFPGSIVDGGTPAWVWLGAGLGVAVAVPVLWWVGRRWSIGFPRPEVGLVTFLRGGPPQATVASEATAPEGGDGGGDGGGTAGDDSGQETPDSPIVSLLRHAGEQLQAGQPGDAIQSCYAAVRHDIESRLDTASALTHWEFYREFREAAEADPAGDGSSGGAGSVGGESSADAGSVGTESSTDALREVTEEYERAAFSPEEVPSDSAQQTVDRASKLCRVDNPVSGDVSRGDD